MKDYKHFVKETVHGNLKKPNQIVSKNLNLCNIGNFPVTDDIIINNNIQTNKLNICILLIWSCKILK